MSGGAPDLLPRWTPGADSARERPRGLLEELVEEGLIAKDFAMPGTTYRVSTKIHCDQRACLFRCAVSRDGAELDRPPFAPIFRNLGGEVTGRPDEPETRRAVARLALEAHLSLCTRLGKALESGGDPGRSRGWERRVLLIGGPGLLLAGAAVAGWYLWPWTERPTVAQPGPPTSAIERAAGAENPGPDAAAPPHEEVLPPAREVEVREKPAVMDGTLPAARPVPGGSRPTKQPQPRSKQQTGEPEQAAVPIAAAQPEPPPPQRPQAPAARDRWPVEEVSPSDRSTLWLRPGEQVYFANGIRLAEVPVAYHDLRCVTTRTADGDTKHTLSFTLTEPSEVFVLHDRGVKKTPDWLDDFAPTGDTVTAIDGGGRVTFRVFRRELPAGRVELGANTRARVVTRILRQATGREAAMYLVCIPLTSAAAQVADGDGP